MRVQFVFPRWPKLPGQTPFNLPPLGMLQAAACVPPGIEVGVLDENVQELDLDLACDLVGISVMLTCQAPRAYELARALRARGKPVVLGGLHVALCPDEAAENADAVVVGEGEGLIERLLEDFQHGRLQRVYRREGFPDISQVPLPRRELYDKQRHYSHRGWELVDLVETSRGCTLDCFPCCTPYLGGRQHRVKPRELVLADIERCSDLLFIVDNSLEQSIEYEKDLFRSLAGCNRRWISHPITCNREVLELAQRSGCWYVYHAIYKVSEKIRDRVKMYHDHGIGVEGTILLGLDEHSEDDIKRLIEFLLTIDLDLAEFTVLTPFPHTKARELLEREGRILDHDWRHYDAGTVVYRPRQISPERLQELYELAWREFYSRESQTVRMSKLFLDVMRDRSRRRSPRAGVTP
jgi:radical SAM superfamily enzyme YgiQ (UPF0313 family)